MWAMWYWWLIHVCCPLPAVHACNYNNTACVCTIPSGGQYTCRPPVHAANAGLH